MILQKSVDITRKYRYTLNYKISKKGDKNMTTFRNNHLQLKKHEIVSRDITG